MFVERSIQKNGLVNLLVLAAAAAVLFVLARMGMALAAMVAALFMSAGALVALVSWFQMRLEERERAEKLEFDELARAKGGAALFESGDAGNFPARQSREQFEKWLVPGFTVLLLLAQGAAAWMLWQWLAQPAALAPIEQPMVILSTLGLVALVLFLIGKFSSTIARLENQRLLRPAATHLLLGAYLAVLAAAGAGGVGLFGAPRLDLFIAKALVVLLGVAAVELLLGLILEVYRPRVRGRVAQPLYESRLLGVLARPEDVFTTAAHTFDYQFGFKVSDTWAFQFFRKALGWLLLAQLGALLLSTTLVFIEPGERGLLERWGKPVAGRAVLAPGLHFKWPFPVDRVHRFRTEQVQTFTVGSQPDPDKAEQPVVLWNLPHAKEELLLVATRDRAPAAAVNGAAARRTPPVSLLAVTVLAHYTISDVKAFAYNHRDSGRLLQSLATREVVQYLASSDIGDVMARSRQEAAEILKRRIQAAADQIEPELGVTVNYIGLPDIHPPVAVAGEFQEVVGAAQKKQAAILAAEAVAIREAADAGARAFKAVAEAEAVRHRAEAGAGARAALFTNQIPAFAAAPFYYAQRAHLQTFARAIAPARKYILVTTNTRDVIQFDLQDRLRADLLDVTVPAGAGR